MDPSNDIVYYEMPPFFAQGIVLPIYTYVEQIYKAVPQLAVNTPFQNENVTLITRINETDPESSFRLNFMECLALSQTMSILKFYYQNLVIPSIQGKEILTDIEKQTLQACEVLMENVIEIADSIFLLFPSIRDPFYQEEIAEKKKKDEAKTLGLDKTTHILYVQLTNQFMVHHIKSLFAFFDYFIINGQSDFSNRVRESAFCCITDVNEVREMFTKAVKATKRNKKRRTYFSLRDVVVFLMLNNIFQKSFFSDGGDHLHNFFADTILNNQDLQVSEVRDYMLKMAKSIEEEFYNLAKDMDGFMDAINPIFNFPV